MLDFGLLWLIWFCVGVVDIILIVIGYRIRVLSDIESGITIGAILALCYNLGVEYYG